MNFNKHSFHQQFQPLIPKASPLLYKAVSSSSSLHRCAHTVFIIFNYIQNIGSFHRAAKLKASKTWPLFIAPSPNISTADIILISIIFVCKSYTCSYWYLCTNNTMTSIEIIFFRKHMHRTTFAFAISIFSS